jgi:putative DNA primase/helicase
MKGEKVARFRRRDVQGEAAQLREQLAAYCAANIEILRDARPELPDALSDRQQDGAEPLLAIADAVGGRWPEKARRALVLLCASAQADDDSIGVRLLSDIRRVFESRGVDRLPSAILACALADIEESPWAEWHNGKPISQPRLAHLLRRYKITPYNIRVNQGRRVQKGYKWDDFADTWSRYLPLCTSPDIPEILNPQVSERYTATDCVNTTGNVDFESATKPPSSVSEKPQIACENAPRSGVAFSEVLMKQKVEEEL